MRDGALSSNKSLGFLSSTHYFIREHYISTTYFLKFTFDKRKNCALPKKRGLKICRGSLLKRHPSIEISLVCFRDFRFDFFIYLCCLTQSGYPFYIPGFASTGDKVMPGNNGLWDMIAALKWVKKNAPVFKGDPNRVVLMGQGSGAAAASILALSPRAEGIVMVTVQKQTASPKNRIGEVFYT